MRVDTTVVTLVSVAALAAGAAAAPSAVANRGDGATRPRGTTAKHPATVRVDQLGYLPDDPKHARLMTAARIANARFAVVDAHGETVLRGRVPAKPVGKWNRNYHAVYDLAFTRLDKPGRYRIRVHGGTTARSPLFRVAGRAAIYGTLLRDGVRFDQVQRDGANVIRGRLDRVPSHLNDRHAHVYARPNFVPGSDAITDHRLHRLGKTTVDVAGGWFDAGDYLKFTHSTAYATDILLFSQRSLGSHAGKAVQAEARHGLNWLDKMWDSRSKTLYMQVGIGSGNRDGTFRGDHDLWRLPDGDDHLRGHLNRFIEHRPVFRAAAPGHKISPNLVGRVSAAFALAAQVDAANHRQRATRELHRATSLYAMADTKSPPRPLVSAMPHAFYPESTWRDDMELGAAEIALAARRLHARSRPYVRDAAHWAKGYIAKETGDTLNLYDTSALAHAELVRVMAETGLTHGLEVTRTDLVDNLRAQIMSAVRHARHDPFRAGKAYDEFDVNSHTFALIATVGLFHQVTGSSRFDAFATSQRNWLLGENAWGVSAMVGVGSIFPLCMQHQIANLNGTIDGSPPIDVGAVVNGPNSAGIFRGGLGGFQDAMVHCPGAPGSVYRPFDGRGSRFVDDVRSWQTDEPALDMTGAAILAGAVQLTTPR
jgi:Glycosyl hydrolase family 9/Cellulase N-terminal ig-like domain